MPSSGNLTSSQLKRFLNRALWLVLVSHAAGITPWFGTGSEKDWLDRRAAPLGCRQLPHDAVAAK